MSKLTCPKCGGEDTAKQGSTSQRGRRYQKVLCRGCGRMSWMGEAQIRESLAATAGRLPAAGLDLDLPHGWKLGKVTAQLSVKDGQMVVEKAWPRMAPDQQRVAEFIEAMAAASLREVAPVKPRKAPKTTNADLACVYPIGDPHVGMYSWGPETGDDWDLAIAERVHVSAMSDLVERAPMAGEAVVLNLGDLYHYDSMVAVTPRSGHHLDADGRYAKVIEVGMMIMRQNVDIALTKHKRVRVVCVRGNHDETGSLWLARWLEAWYRNEPRVTVEVSPSVFMYYRFGSNFLGFHHGHTAKMDKLAAVMATDRAKDWGECVNRHWLTGHIHHRSVIESPGCMVESFGTLAGKDAYAHDGGWRSARKMECLVYHKRGRLQDRLSAYAEDFV